MDSSQFFMDIPQIDDMNDDMAFSQVRHWPVSEDQYDTHASLPHYVGGGRAAVYSEMNLPLRLLEGVDMQPIDRYFHGSDGWPFAPNTSYADFRNAGPRGFQPLRPETYNGSPVFGHHNRSTSPDGSESLSSSWSAHHSVDLCHVSTYVQPQMKIDCALSPTWTTCEDMSNLHFNSPPISGGGHSPFIALSQLQRFPEEIQAVSALDHDDTQDADGEYDHDWEHPHAVRDMEVPALTDDSVDTTTEHAYNGHSDEEEDDANDSEFKPSRSSKRTSKRRLSTTSTKSRNSGTSGVTKKKTKSKSPATKSGAIVTRPFPCPLALYGCRSTFANKNEWKRHVSTQHVKLGYFRCSECPTDSSPNDFNRKDLFTQHLRRLHRPVKPEFVGVAHADPKIATRELTDSEIADFQRDCWCILRQAPNTSKCFFCAANFVGEGSWDERMEHVAGHMDRGRRAGSKVLDPSTWKEDEQLRDWYEQEGLIELDLRGRWQIGNGIPRR